MASSRVLVVEDDPLTALVVAMALEEGGYDVCGVASSEGEALTLAEKIHPDLAVVDVSLSPGDGRKVAAALWRKYTTAVLFATAQCDEIRGLMGTGAFACLPKPFTTELVVDALRAVSRMAAGDRSTPLPGRVFALAAG